MLRGCDVEGLRVVMLGSCDAEETKMKFCQQVDKEIQISTSHHSTISPSHLYLSRRRRCGLIC